MMRNLLLAKDSEKANSPGKNGPRNDNPGLSETIAENHQCNSFNASAAM
jgi:hypothetical protein